MSSSIAIQSTELVGCQVLPPGQLSGEAQIYILHSVGVLFLTAASARLEQPSSASVCIR